MPWFNRNFKNQKKNSENNRWCRRMPLAGNLSHWAISTTIPNIFPTNSWDSILCNFYLYSIPLESTEKVIRHVNRHKYYVIVRFRLFWLGKKNLGDGGGRWWRRRCRRPFMCAHMNNFVFLFCSFLFHKHFLIFFCIPCPIWEKLHAFAAAFAYFKDGFVCVCMCVYFQMEFIGRAKYERVALACMYLYIYIYIFLSMPSVIKILAENVCYRAKYEGM